MDTYSSIVTILRRAVKIHGGKAALLRVLGTSKATYYKALDNENPVLPATRTLCTWLDALHAQVFLPGDKAIAEYAYVPQIPPDALVGGVVARQNATETGPRISISRSWFADCGIDPRNCYAVSGMALGDTVRISDVILIDTAQTSLDDGSVYALSILDSNALRAWQEGQLLFPPQPGHPMLKRAQRVPDGWRLCGDTLSAPPFVVQDITGIVVHGRVVRQCRDAV
ncbi:MAG: hypothetical protein K6C33_06005 [Desulfovibrio sp.]|nr:hypothetical protein [Desulfovibrio sp.]